MKVLFRHVYFIAAVVLMFSAQLGLAATNEIKGKHLENELTCKDCHGVNKPETAATQKICIDCHSDMVDSDWIIFKEKGHEYEHSPHDSHESPIACTSCHAIHKPTKLYCNTCHEFENKVP